MRRLKTALVYAAVAGLVCANAALILKIAALKSELRSTRGFAEAALAAEGFYRARLVSQHRLLKKVDSGLQPVVDAAGLHIAAHERATVLLKTKTRGPGLGARDLKEVKAEPLIPKPESRDYVPVPWSDGRLTLESYDAQSDALTYSLRQRFRLRGTYLADERGQIRFGKLELYEIAPEGFLSRHPELDSGSQSEMLSQAQHDKEGDILSTAEITDYELLAAKTKSRWRPEFGIKAGVEVGLDDEAVGLSPLLTGIVLGAEVEFGKFGVFGYLDIKEHPTVLVGAGWKW